VDSRFQVQQLEEDGGGSTEQSWMETSSLWPPGATSKSHIIFVQISKDKFLKSK